MTRHNWTHIGKTLQSDIWVDYRARKTKITTPKYIYVHDGIYPYHEPMYTKKYVRTI